MSLSRFWRIKSQGVENHIKSLEEARDGLAQKLAELKAKLKRSVLHLLKHQTAERGFRMVREREIIIDLLKSCKQGDGLTIPSLAKKERRERYGTIYLSVKRPDKEQQDRFVEYDDGTWELEEINLAGAAGTTGTHHWSRSVTRLTRLTPATALGLSLGKGPRWATQ